MSRARDVLDVEANLSVYLSARLPDDRYASFDYCFNFFQSRAEEGRTADLAQPPLVEMACLELGFYLASWGMYRGSTDLLKRSAAHLARTVEVIATSPPEIWSCDANNYSDSSCSLILDVAAEIRAAFPKPATDTLVTKIMLGAFGCVPAFDTQFKKGFGVWKFNRAALRRIAEFYDANADVIERHRVPTLDFATGANTTRLYTRAKVIDMVFFTQGAG